MIYNGRLNKVIKSVKQLIPNGEMVLDIGCGQGNFSLLLAEAGYEVIGGDVEPEALEYARMKYEFGNCTFVVTEWKKPAFQKQVRCHNSK